MDFIYMTKQLIAVWVFIFLGFSSTTFAEEPIAVGSSELKPIAVEVITSDKKIQKRLSDILTAIGSYEKVQVKVISGVVILAGLVDEESQIDWAQRLAARMDGVVAVQNRLKSPSKEILDFSPARNELDKFKLTVMRQLPITVLAILVLAISLFLFFFAAFGFRRAFANKISSPLLLNATSKLLAIPVFLLGLYLALRISGLAGLAFTVLGGTGLFGLVVGLGLKNSFEDYAASIFLSIKKPFRPSDLVNIGSIEGIVQKVTSRSTLIIDYEGNHVLIPNSIVYKSIIINKTANPKMRGDFTFGIDYGDSIEEAQKEVLNLLANSQLVLKDPEPWVLVDELGGSSVNLRVYFWLNVREVSIYKVTSHLLLEVKNLLLAKGFRFPDPQREIVFTNQLALGREENLQTKQNVNHVPSKPLRPDEVRAEATELNRQARESDLPYQGEDVL
jgi:small conductance mechanosensitive channel